MKLGLFIILLPLVFSNNERSTNTLEHQPRSSKIISTTTTSTEPLPEEDICRVEGQRDMRVGEAVIPDPPKCYRIHCQGRNKPFYEGCQVIKVGKNCHGSFYDMSVRYPNCCPREICP